MYGVDQNLPLLQICFESLPCPSRKIWTTSGSPNVGCEFKGPPKKRDKNKDFKTGPRVASPKKPRHTHTHTHTRTPRLLSSWPRATRAESSRRCRSPSDPSDNPPPSRHCQGGFTWTFGGWSVATKPGPPNPGNWLCGSFGSGWGCFPLNPKTWLGLVFFHQVPTKRGGTRFQGFSGAKGPDRPFCWLNVGPILINPCLYIWECHHFWRGTPHINNQGLINMGSTLWRSNFPKGLSTNVKAHKKPISWILRLDRPAGANILDLKKLAPTSATLRLGPPHKHPQAAGMLTVGEDKFSPVRTSSSRSARRNISILPAAVEKQASRRLLAAPKKHMDVG